ncbi:hypothetical protein GALL_28580 [mine drainage metagenome]|uniref:DUF86 domain-containing protein n=1 Tax=mine drainage metagenome TaxID=410659 RepID=A0A1J5TL62_9ZZZZ
MSRADALRLPEYLRHILEAIERISRYVEASRNIGRYHDQFADEHDYLPLNFAYEMRNALAHGYFKVDLQIVWKTIQVSLPQLHQQVRQLLDGME